MPSPLIILGASARAAAQWAIRRGFSPWCIDLFADRDLAVLAPVKRCPADRYPDAMVDMLDDAPDAPVLLTGAMENYPHVLRRIEAKRALLNWTVEQIIAVRDPQLWSVPIPVKRAASAAPYLVKQHYGAAGRGVRFWRPGETLAPDEYLQPFFRGQSISAVFVGGRCLGATRQIIGDPALGASGFQYAGSIGPIPTPPDLADFGSRMAQRFGLRGLFGIDAILDDSGRAHPVEINPRYTASVEVLDRAAGETSGETSGGKAYVFARRHCRVGDLYEHFMPDEIADVPAPGGVVRRGQPVCTVYARHLPGQRPGAGLHALADRLYTRCLHDVVVPTR